MRQPREEHAGHTSHSLRAMLFPGIPADLTDEAVSLFRSLLSHIYTLR